MFDVMKGIHYWMPDYRRVVMLKILVKKKRTWIMNALDWWFYSSSQTSPSPNCTLAHADRIPNFNFRYYHSPKSNVLSNGLLKSFSPSSTYPFKRGFGVYESNQVLPYLPLKVAFLWSSLLMKKSCQAIWDNKSVVEERTLQS